MIQDATEALDHHSALIHPGTLSGALALLAVFVVGGLVLTWLLRRGIRLMMARDRDGRIDRLTASFLAQIGQVFLWLFVLTLYAHAVPVLNKLGDALLASVSIASVVVGLAAQSTLANLVAGLSLVFYRSFRLGDQLQIAALGGSETGTVEIVSLGYTILRTADDRRVVLSNSTIANAVMINLTLVSPRAMASVPFSIEPGADIDAARAIAVDLAAAHSGVEEVVACPVTGLGASSVDLTLRAWCKNTGAASGVVADLTEAIRKRLDAAGLAFPFPTRKVVLKRDGPAPSER